MGVHAFFAVFVGAGLGACLRWWLGLVLNPLWPTLPLGTLKWLPVLGKPDS